MSTFESLHVLHPQKAGRSMPAVTAFCAVYLACVSQHHLGGIAQVPSTITSMKSVYAD